MKVNIRITAWVSACFCLILLTLGAFLWLSSPRAIPAESPTVATSNTLSTRPTSITQNPAVNPQKTVVSPQSTVVNPTATTLVSPPLTPVDYPTASIGEACELNNFPPYHLDREIRIGLENNPIDNNGRFKQFEEEKCRLAVENHMNSINPNLWGREHTPHGFHSAHALVDIDNPLTFERIFVDPAGDFARVQEALAHPECQLGQDTATNWQLNEACYADAILNYAMVSRFCHNSGILMRPKQYYSKEDNPTPEQDRRMWIELFESGWVSRKCQSLDPHLNLRLPVHTELRQQIKELQLGDKNKSVNVMLIELAARLGDKAAWLAHPLEINWLPQRPKHNEEGYKYGPLAEWFTTDLGDPTTLFSKLTPSVDRFRHLVPLFGENIKAKGKVINFDHQALARHLCTPPYHIPPSVDEAPTSEPPSCREIVNELRQEKLSPSMLKAITTFEDVAIRLDVYE